MNLTKQELKDLGHSKLEIDLGKGDDLWNSTLKKIKQDRNGKYPPDWFQKAILGIRKNKETEQDIQQF